MKNLSTILFIILVNTLTHAQSPPEFTSAEERIVYNKEHNLDKYTGILVEYSYKIVCSKPYQDKELIDLASSFFKGAVGTEIYEHNGIRYLSILTEGARKNHQASYELRDREFKKFEFYKRNYHMK